MPSTVAGRAFLLRCCLPALAVGAGYAVPINVFAQVSRPSVTLDLDSGKLTGRIPFDEVFEFEGKAPLSLVQVQILFQPAAAFSQDSCYRGRFPSNGALTWIRRDNRSTYFVIDRSAVKPNVPYTLCVRTVARSDSANAAFRTRAASRMIEAAKRYFAKETERVATAASVDSLRTALTSALPRADSIVFEDTSGALLPYDTVANRLRGSALDSLYQSWEQRYFNVVDDTARFAADADSLKRTLLALRPELQLTRLDSVAALMKTDDADQKRFAAAASAARSLPHRDERQLLLISTGATSLSASDENAADVPFEPRKGAELTPAVAQLRETARQLQDLSDLALFAVTSVAIRPTRRGSDAIDRERVSDSLVGSRTTAASAFLTKIRNDVELLAHDVDSMSASAESLVAHVSTVAFRRIGIQASSATDYVSAAKDYIDADIGVLGAAGTPFNVLAGGVVTGYIGVNFFFDPVNREAPYGVCRRYSVFKCLSFTIGMTTGSVARTNARADLFGSHSLYVAAGYRLTSYLRLGVGALVFQSYSPDSRRALRITATPALSLALNWDVKSTLGGLRDILTGK